MNEKPSYYSLHAEERKAYQKKYYQQHKREIARTKELQAILNPKKREKTQAYQRDYYLKNREVILQKKRDRYLAKKRG